MRRIISIITMAVIMAVMTVASDLPAADAALQDKPIVPIYSRIDPCSAWTWEWYWSESARRWYWEYYRYCDSGIQWDGWGWA